MLQRTTLIALTAATMVLIFVGTGWATDGQPTQQRDQIQTQDQEQIFGSEFMTPEERAEYRDRMRRTTTEQERENIRREHHEQMKERAEQRGVTLPDAPPDRGMERGMGPGGGMGGGMGPGPGGGMGGGRR